MNILIEKKKKSVLFTRCSIYIDLKICTSGTEWRTVVTPFYFIYSCDTSVLSRLDGEL